MLRTHSTRPANDRGIAMITTLLVLMLMTALLVGFTTVVMTDQRYRFIDRDRGQAFYAASAGIEKLTADLGNLFLSYVAPTQAQVQALTVAAKMPVITGITFTSPTAPGALPASQLTTYHCAGTPGPPAVVKTPTAVGTNGYTITFCKSNTTNNPTVSDDNLIVSGTGAFAQMTALQTPYQLDVTAKTSTGGEVHLSRTIQAVAIPVFQFGIFSDVDQSFFAGPNFTMGGRVHTNGNLWLAQGPGATLTMLGRVTAFKDIMRQTLSNGNSIDNGPTWTGTVSLATNANAPVGNRNLLRTEGSVGNAGWQTLSLGASPANYNGYLRNGPGAVTQPGTGAKKLSLPLISPGVGGTNVDIVRRPPVGEDTASILYNERLFTKASIRILISDTAADITSIPGIAAGNPVSLEQNWNVAANLPAGPPAYALGATRPPIAMSAGARMTTVTAAGGGATLTTTAPNTFRPTFSLSNTPNSVITCTAGTATTFTGCNGSPTLIIASALPLTVQQLSPAGNPIGVSAQTLSNTGGANATITFLAAQRNLLNFAPMPFWDVSLNPPVLVTCTGQTAATYTGCSPAPGNSDVLVSGYMSDAGISTLGGYIKIERNNADNSGWTDITTEILNYGIGDSNANINSAALGYGTGVVCGAGTIAPNAIVRLQRLRDNSGNCAAANGSNYNTVAGGVLDPTNWWPNVLYDVREGAYRDSNYPGANNLTLGGVMHYVNIDVGNLTKWFAHNTAPFNVAASTGNLSKIDGTGFSVYFSDRRNNRNAAAQETGEYGYEDFVNPAVANGVPNGTLQTGEDVNENGLLDVYGGTPNYTGPAAGAVPTVNQTPPCGVAPNPQTCAVAYAAAATGGFSLSNAARPQSTLLAYVAQVNRPIIFRRALMLSNARDFATGVNGVVADKLTGLTIVAENPVYIRGDWNADSPAGGGVGFGGVNAATSVIADAVTLLSNQWADANSFQSPYSLASRVVNMPTNQGWYRLAIIAGKGPSFPLPTVGGGIAPDFGTDGGAHNFLRLLEDWSGPGAVPQQTVNYLGSLATLYYNRQAVGPYKCCTTVYGAPLRAFSFDVNFVNPALLPPLTPMFRDVNVIGFSQELRPGR